MKTTAIGAPVLLLACACGPRTASIQRTYTELKVLPESANERDWPAWVEVPAWAKERGTSEEEGPIPVRSSMVLDVSLLTYPADRPLEWKRKLEDHGPDGAVFTDPHFSPFLLKGNGFSILSADDAEDLVRAAGAQGTACLTTRLLLKDSEPSAKGNTSSDTGTGVVFFAKPLAISDYDATLAFSFQGAGYPWSKSDEPLTTWTIADEAKLPGGQRYVKMVQPDNGDDRVIVLLHVATISHTPRDETHAERGRAVRPRVAAR